MSQQPMKYWIHKEHCIREDYASATWPHGIPDSYKPFYPAADVEAVEARLKFLEAGNPYASKEWGDLVAVSGKAKGDVLAAKLLISQLQHALAAKDVSLQLAEEQLQHDQAELREANRLLNEARIDSNGEGGYGKRETLTTPQRIAVAINQLAAKEARVVELERWFHGYRTPEHSMKAMLGELTQMREILRKIARWCPQDASCDGCALAHKYAHAALERKDIA